MSSEFQRKEERNAVASPVRTKEAKEWGQARRGRDTCTRSSWLAAEKATRDGVNFLGRIATLQSMHKQPFPLYRIIIWCRKQMGG